MRTTLLLFALSGCAAPPDGKSDARAYVSDLEPLVYENGLMAQALLQIAAEAHNTTTVPASMTRWWHDDFAPLSEHLAQQAAILSPPSGWADRHAGLVSVWEQRAQAYRDLDTAVAQGDATLWQQARATADTAKIREEEWFQTTDVALAPFGLALDQYP